MFSVLRNMKVLETCIFRIEKRCNLLKIKHRYFKIKVNNLLKRLYCLIEGTKNKLQRGRSCPSKNTPVQHSSMGDLMFKIHLQIYFHARSMPTQVGAKQKIISLGIAENQFFSVSKILIEIISNRDRPPDFANQVFQKRARYLIQLA